MQKHTDSINEKGGGKMQRFLHALSRHGVYAIRMAELFIVFCIWRIISPQYTKKNHWLICEKRNEARDNGYHFYKYLRMQHPEIEAYYVITKDSPDFEKVAKLGNIVIANSFKHCLLYLTAKYSISSQAYGAFPFELSLPYIRFANRLCRNDQKTVFLQHGIIKDELAHGAFDYDKCNIDYFVCSAQREYEFVKEKYNYPEKGIGCVGLCRFDYLLRARDEVDNILLIMPTWRMWLKREKDGVPLSEAEVTRFKASNFYKNYATILTDRKLLSTLRKNKMKIIFYLHYQMQDYSPVFNELENDVVVIADRYKYDVQTLLIKAKLLVTDYSSVYFDFAFMNKPMIHYQFDKSRFEGSHYAKGYFEYERDGFGPCVYTKAALVDEISVCLRSDCTMPKVYEGRVNQFFPHRDDKNCERTFSALTKL